MIRIHFDPLKDSFNPIKSPNVALEKLEFSLLGTRMFSILQKPPDNVNAEDLETLQNEIERCLIDVVTKKWDLERELTNLHNTSPESDNLTPAISSPQVTTTSTLGKLRVSHRLNQQESSENSCDGFRGTLFDSSDDRGDGSASGSNNTEDSVSSEGSLVSSLTTTITSIIPDSGSQTQNTNSSYASGTKRTHKGNSDRPSKRFRQNSSNLFASTGVYAKRPTNSKHRSKVVPSKFRNSLEDSRPHKKQINKNEAPDKLWPFVEQFCASPTEDQMKDLEDMIKSMEYDKDYFKVPALGKKDSSNKESPTKLDSANTKNQKRPRSSGGEETTGLGALTQRLVSSLIEDSDDNISPNNKPGNTAQSAKKKNSKPKNGKGIDMNNAKNLEKRIRQELEEYEILDKQDDIPYTSEEDEVLRDLIICQHELLSIQQQNKDSIQRLLKKAKRHVELEREREKLQEANADVIAAYQRLIQAKQRKRNPTKREKDAAWKALKVHEAIFRKCDELYLSCTGRGNFSS